MTTRKLTQKRKRICVFFFIIKEESTEYFEIFEEKVDT